MKQSLFAIKENIRIAPDMYEMALLGDVSAITVPGQFVNIALDGLYLRRPISVHDVDSETGILRIIYKAVGKGTEIMASMTHGETLDVLTGLGNGFDIQRAGQNTLVIGGGAGAPPMFWTAKALRDSGRSVTAILGFNTAEEVILQQKFEAAGIPVIITTADGSFGTKGFVTAALADLPAPDYTFSCGPEPMLRAVYDATACGGQFSFEERMGCGFGACMGCSCETKYGAKRICKDGPVLEKEEILW